MWHSLNSTLCRCSYGVKMVMLADGAGADETYVSCLHLEPGAWILEVPALRDTGIFVVHGGLTLFMSSAAAPPAPKFISKCVVAGFRRQPSIPSRPFPFATHHPVGPPPATAIGSPIACRYSSSPIACTDRNFASSASISERSPGPGVPCANEL